MPGRSKDLVPNMRILSLAFLAVLMPGLALAQAPGGGTSGANPLDRCRDNYQHCVRACTGADMQNCMMQCDTSRAQCVQNPSGQRPPRR
jgi:hypothetical protein